MILPRKEEFLEGIQQYEKHEKRDSMYKVAQFLLHHHWGNFSEMADGLGVLLLTWNQAFYRYGSFDFDVLEMSIFNNFNLIEHYNKLSIFDLYDSDKKDMTHLFNDFYIATQINTLRFENDKSGKQSIIMLKKILNQLNIKYNGNNIQEIYNSLLLSKINNALDYNNLNDYLEIVISNLSVEEKDCLEKLNEKNKIIKRSPVSVAKTLHLLAPNFFPLWDDNIARCYKCYYNENPADKYFSFCKQIKNVSETLRNYTDRKDKTLIRLIDEYNYSKYTKKWIK